jgi:hypothetical protein
LKFTLSHPNKGEDHIFTFCFRSSIPSLPTSPEEAANSTTSPAGQDAVDNLAATPVLRQDEIRQLDHEPEVVMVIPLYEGRCDEPPGSTRAISFFLNDEVQ